MPSKAGQEETAHRGDATRGASVRFDRVSRRYGSVEALREFSLDIAAGESVG